MEGWTSMKKWLVIRDCGAHAVRNDFPVLGVAEVHHNRPLPNEITIGLDVPNDPWFFQVQGFDTTGHPLAVESVGTFGFIQVWPAAKPVYEAGRTFQWACDVISRAEYETYLEFELFPKCHFFTQAEMQFRREAPRMARLILKEHGKRKT